MAKSRRFTLTGMGVFRAGVAPALGVVAVKAVPPQNRGAALAGLYAIFTWICLWGLPDAGGAGDDTGGRAGDLSGGSRGGCGTMALLLTGAKKRHSRVCTAGDNTSSS